MSYCVKIPDKTQYDDAITIEWINEWIAKTDKNRIKTVGWMLKDWYKEQSSKKK